MVPREKVEKGAIWCILSVPKYAIINLKINNIALFLVFFLVSRDCCVALPHAAMGLSAVCACGFPDHTHLLFLRIIKLINNT